MEPLSALSLAAGVIQIVDFSAKLVKTCTEIQESSASLSLFHEAAHVEATKFSECAQTLRDRLATCHAVEGHLTNEQKNLRDTSKQCVDAAEDLEGLLAALKLSDEGTRKRKRNLGPTAIRSILSNSKVRAAQQKLQKCRDQLDSEVLISLRQVHNIDVFGDAAIRVADGAIGMTLIT